MNHKMKVALNRSGYIYLNDCGSVNFIYFLIHISCIILIFLEIINWNIELYINLFNDYVDLFFFFFLNVTRNNKNIIHKELFFFEIVDKVEYRIVNLYQSLTLLDKIVSYIYLHSFLFVNLFLIFY